MLSTIFRARYEKMDFQTKDLEDAVGAQTLLSDDKATVLMGRMRNPSLSIRQSLPFTVHVYSLKH